MAELTTDQARERFLDHVRALVDYWDREASGDQRHRLEGVAFSILVLLDGGSGHMPGWVVCPSPHPEDRAYCEAQGEEYWPEAPDAGTDIAGSLHELFFHRGRWEGR
jgi:hypothetical protein